MAPDQRTQLMDAARNFRFMADAIEEKLNRELLHEMNAKARESEKPKPGSGATLENTP